MALENRSQLIFFIIQIWKYILENQVREGLKNTRQYPATNGTWEYSSIYQVIGYQVREGLKNTTQRPATDGAWDRSGLLVQQIRNRVGLDYWGRAGPALDLSLALLGS